MKLLSNYHGPTPKKWKKIGDTIMLFGAGASTGVMGLPLPDNQKLWIVWGLGILTLIGKAVTNLATTDDAENKSLQ